MKSIKNIEDFKSIIASNKPVLLDFYADWCGPCQMMLPTVEKLAEKYKDSFEIVKVNVDNNQDIAQHFGVRSIPALFFIQDGKVTDQMTGVQTETVLENKIQSHLVEA